MPWEHGIEPRPLTPEEKAELVRRLSDLLVADYLATEAKEQAQLASAAQAKESA